MARRANRPSLLESMGLLPFSERMRQARIALGGDEDVPKSRFDPSSLRLLSPRLALPLWLGYDAVPRKVVITNLFNHTQTPVALGWSVRRTQVRDFRGKRQTYDSHNGTDFCIARGTPVLAGASGHVIRVVSEFHRGGLKVAIDHGGGLITSSAHLARALVREGQAVKRGEVIAISGYSGLDSLVSFPWGIPHIHYNVWLDGQPIDPFAREHDEVDGGARAEASLWIGGDAPIPMPTGVAPEESAWSEYDAARVDEVIGSCITPSVRARLQAITLLHLRGGQAVFESNYYPTRFPDRASTLREVHARAPRLHLPFSEEHFDGCVFRDELEDVA
jgi:hypothetical protein